MQSFKISWFYLYKPDVLSLCLKVILYFRAANTYFVKLTFSGSRALYFLLQNPIWTVLRFHFRERKTADIRFLYVSGKALLRKNIFVMPFLVNISLSFQFFLRFLKKLKIILAIVEIKFFLGLFSFGERFVHYIVNETADRRTFR